MPGSRSHLAAVVGLAATLLHLLVPAGWPRTAAYQLVALTCLALMAVGVRRNRPRHQPAWWLVIAGNALMVAGDLVYAALDAVRPGGAGLTDHILWLAAYPVLAAGLYLSARRRRSERAALLDVAIFALAGGTTIWTLLLAPHAGRMDWTEFEDAVGFAYPMMDVLVLALSALLALHGGWRLASQRYATIALGLLLVADIVYSDLALHEGYVPGSLVDAAWLLSYVTWAAAALHPTMRQVAEPLPMPSPLLARSHVGLLALVTASVVALSMHRATVAPGELEVLLAASIAVVVLALLRLTTVVGWLRASVVHESERADQRLAALARNASDVIMVLDADGVVSYISPSIQPVLGWTPDEIAALPPFALLHPNDHARVTGTSAWSLARQNRSGVPVPISVRFRHKRGDWRDVEVVGTDFLDDPAISGLVLNIRDVTDRKALEEELAHQAFHDSLTGLPNRMLFADRVDHALQQRADEPSPRRTAVLFCDLDDFKAINDSFGHKAGDEVLVAIATQLAGAIRPGDTVARLGGDEFAVLLEGITDDASVDHIAHRVLAALRGRFELEGRSVFVTGCVGVAAGLPETTDAPTLMRDADAAMYSAKRDGKNQWAWFDAGMRDEVMARLALEGELRVALVEEQLEIHYQPVVALDSMVVTGAEALVRWRHPTRGLLSPCDFIPVAEESGLIAPLGWWVLERACEFAAGVRRTEISEFTVSVNLSAMQVAEPRLVDQVAKALSSAGLPPSALVLELTESLVISDSTAVITRLQELEALGVRVAIDDFGTGYSSLSYLQTLPIDILKIDKSFVDRVGGPDADLVPTILDVARTLGLRTIAEGVEATDQAMALNRLGCERAQGFLFARPVPAEEFARAVREASDRPALGSPIGSRQDTGAPAAARR